MTEFAKEIIIANIEDELRKSYLDYAMSVIVGRALPDVKDGLKPVHRRVLYAMKEMGNDANKAYKKSARIVGDVIGKYHPHGDSAVYDALVRMAQDFSLRYPLIDGQGNFGSVDGDSPAAMRYTEVRLAKIAHELMDDLDRETVDFQPNYDGGEREPKVFPAQFPNLLVNGSSGIAVGMATNIPPHNLTQTINACLALLEEPGLSIDELMQHLPGPDFPTGGIINGVEGIRNAYHTGKGRVIIRGEATIEQPKDRPDRNRIVITELPYQVNKAYLQEKIALLVKEKKLEGITGIRDESDRDGMRVVIELRRGEVPEVVLNNLFKQTQLQNSFGINMVGLVNGEPKLLNLKQILDVFIRHRCEVVSRRCLFELRKARQRAHLLEGLAVALANIDEVIKLIRASSSSQEARGKLIDRDWAPAAVADLLLKSGSSEADKWDREVFEGGLSDLGYRLSEKQAQAILDMRLHRLTGLEQDKIFAEYHELLESIAGLIAILSSSTVLRGVVRDELILVRDRYGDERRTRIVEQELNVSMEDLIIEEDVVVVLSRLGYIKSQPVSEYRSQRRGGRGRSATKIKDEDVIDSMFVTSTHATVLFFSSLGKAYWVKAYELPQAGSAARGKPIVNILPLEEGEEITAMLPIQVGDPGYLFFASAQGRVKKSALAHFSRPRANGIIALDLAAGDRLIGVSLTSGEDDVMLFTDVGKVVRFSEKAVRAMGRTARGVKGITLKTGQKVIALLVPRTGAVLTATQKGFGKRTKLEDYPGHGRGGQGVISIQTSERNGAVVGAVQVEDDDEMILMSDQGTLIRTPVNTVALVSRNTQGVKLINLAEGESLVGLVRVPMVEAELGEDLDSGSNPDWVPDSSIENEDQDQDPGQEEPQPDDE